MAKQPHGFGLKIDRLLCETSESKAFTQPELDRIGVTVA